MKRKLAGLLLMGALTGSGCVSTQQGAFMSQAGQGGAQCGPSGCMHGAYRPQVAQGVVGPWGQPITAPPGAPQLGSSHAGPADEKQAAENAARQTFLKGVPPQIAAQVLAKNGPQGGANFLASGVPMQGGVVPAGGPMPPGGGLMQASGFTQPPGPIPPVGSGLPGAVAAVGTLQGGPSPFACSRSSIRFAGPNGMKVSWYVPGADGKVELTKAALEVPGRYNFSQAGIYRLKLSNIPGRPGMELYPTLEVVPANAKTSTFLQHSSVPLNFTQEDFDQVAAGNYLVKVVYLPNPQFQDLAVTGEVVSTRLEPGTDPIAEALQRGSILLVVRMGNIDLEAPNTPPIDAPSAYQPKLPPPPVPGAGMMPPQGGDPRMMAGPGMMPQQGQPGMMPPGMMPPGMMPPGMQRPGQGGPMIPGFMPPPPGAAPGTPTATPPGPGASTGTTVPKSVVQASQSEEQASEAEKTKDPEKKKSSSWLPSIFDKKAGK